MSTKKLLFKIVKAFLLLTGISTVCFVVFELWDSIGHSGDIYMVNNIDEYLFMSVLISIVPAIFYSIARHSNLKQFFVVFFVITKSFQAILFWDF